MCLSCGRFWTALQILWSFVYVVCGAAQLMAGIFFTISVPELHLYSILFAGSWNIVIGICGGMVACIGMFSSKRQEILLYMAISILAVNCVNFIIMEYVFYIADLSKLLRNYTNHMLIDYACFATRVASAAVLVVSFFDSQLSFCSMQSVAKVRGKKVRRSHEQVSDIEYIIPRPTNSKAVRQPSQAIYDAYAQSWVFEGDENTTSQPGSSTTTNRAYFKVVQNGTPKKGATKEKKVTTNGVHNGTVKENGHVTTDHRPLVHIESASDSSHSDRQLNYMKSFSRSQSPMVLSAGSSQLSLENTSPQHSQTHNPPPIYECLERLTEPTLYRSRLNTALSSKDETEPQYQTPQTVIMRRVEATSPRVEKVQYASLMKELQKAIVSKKESSSITSPQSNNSDSAPASEKTKSSKSEGNSDVEFSKELEAALQLIQDLESPNTIETPSEAKFPLDSHHQNRALAVWRTNDASESSEKTLSAVGSLAELTSPLNECQPELYTFKPPANGKGASVIVRYPDSQSTSGYSSPTHGPTPNWSTTSSINGSNPEIKPTSYSIHNTNSATVISLYSSQTQTKTKQVTLVKIIGDDSSTKISTNPNPEPTPTKITKQPSLNSIDLKEKLASFRAISLQPTSWKLNSLLRRKKTNTLPKLAPELEGAIIKSESLAYLTDLELLARHQRNQELQREIEKRVVQQLGVPKTARTESNC